MARLESAAISGAHAVGTVSSGSSTIFNRVEGATPYWVTKYVNTLTAVDAYSAPRSCLLGLKNTCRSMPASSALNSWKVPAMIVPGKLGLSQVKLKVLEFAITVAGFFVGAAAGDDSFPLPITTMCAGTVTLMVEVKRLTPYPATGNHSP